jgi:hypothetical protein
MLITVSKRAGRTRRVRTEHVIFGGPSLSFVVSGAQESAELEGR